ncbi:MAG: hypothetical protein HRU08_05180, partial [Oleispira sp.]|nr:hypothetical protein [Oleispira sp.]
MITETPLVIESLTNNKLENVKTLKIQDVSSTSWNQILAAKLDLSSYLSSNFLPDVIYQHQRCIRTILAAAEKHGLPVVKIMFELTQIEKISDSGHIKCFVDYYR